MSKIVNYQTASLVLKTSDAIANNAYNNSFTWYNVSLKTLLGSGFFEKFELFNICLVQVGTGICNNALGVTTNDLAMAIKMTGFNFINQTFTSSRNTETGIATAGFLNLTRGSATNQSYYANNALTFRKQDNVNITIYYNTLEGDIAVNGGGQTYPNTTFIFQIVGVKEQDYNEKNVMINTSRKPTMIK